MSVFRIAGSLLFIFLSTCVRAQSPGDCTGAIPLCQNLVTVGPNTFNNTGAVNDENNATCWNGTGMAGSVWYSFTPETAGKLGFSLTPAGGTDYDYALFDITNGCASMNQLSCNFSVEYGATGMDDNSSDWQDDMFFYPDCNCNCANFNDQDCNRWNDAVTVDPTRNYVLMINYYSGANEGFTFNFQFEPGLVSIEDNTPPTVSSISTPNCGENTVTVNFSEGVVCSSIQNNDFTLTGPGGPFNVTSVDLSQCNASGTVSQVTLTLDNSFVTGNYNLNSVNVEDPCGNILITPGDDDAFTVTAVLTPAITGNTSICSGQTTTLPASPSGAGYSYLWSPGGETTQSITVGTGGNYSVTITSACGSDVTSITVNETAITTITPTISGATSVCDNGQTTSLSASPAGMTYSWNTGSSSQSITVGAGTYTVTVLPSTPSCQQGTSVPFTVNAISCGAVDFCNDGTNLIASGGDGNYTWAQNTGWFGLYVNVGTGSPFAIASLDDGNKKIRLTSGDGQVITYNNLASVPACASSCTPPELSGIVDDVNCQGGNDASIDLSTTGSSIYSFAWTNGAVSEDISTLISGNYSVTVIDQADPSCTASASFMVNDGVAGPTATLSGNGAICNGDQATLYIDLTGIPDWVIEYAIDGVSQPLINNYPNAQYSFQTGTEGSYTMVLVSDAGGCPGTVSGTLNVQVTPDDDPGFSLTDFCEGSPNNAVVTGLTGGSFTFNPLPVDGVIIDNITGEITAAVGGSNYTVQYTTTGSCPASLTQNVIVFALPVLDAGFDFAECVGNMITLTAGNPNGSSISWDNGVNDGVPFIQTISQVTYTLSGTDANGCQNSDQITVTMNPLPVVDAGADQSVCEGAQVILYGSGASAYSWSNGVTDGLAFTQPAGTSWYYLTGTDLNTCQNIDSVKVIVHALAEFNTFTGGADYCEGDLINPLAISVNGSPDWLLTYTIDGVQQIATGSQSPIVLDNVPGLYLLVDITDGNSCMNSISGSQEIRIFPIPSTPQAGNDTTYCLNTIPEMMYASGLGGTFIWYIDPYLNDSIGVGASLLPGSNNATYYVTETVNNCESEAAIVIIEYENCELIIPTAFTPEGNEPNNVWQIVNIDEVYPNNVVSVYNRWGNLIFNHRSDELNPYNSNAWDGTYKGEPMPVASYYFIIEMNDGNGMIEKGTVSIIKTN